MEGSSITSDSADVSSDGAVSSLDEGVSSIASEDVSTTDCKIVLMLVWASSFPSTESFTRQEAVSENSARSVLRGSI